MYWYPHSEAPNIIIARRPNLNSLDILNLCAKKAASYDNAEICDVKRVSRATVVNSMSKSVGVMC